MAKRSTVRLDDPRFAGRDADVFSVRINKEMENGFVGKLGDIEAANRDIRELKATATGDSIVLVANPAIVVDNARMGSGLEANYFMEANEAIRAYGVKATYVFSVSEEGINGTAVVGQYVVAGAGNKLVPSTTIPATGFAGKVVRKDAVGGALAVNLTQTPTNYVVIDTIQN